jgi:hypothetical protein
MTEPVLTRLALEEAVQVWVAAAKAGSVIRSFQRAND